MKSLIALIGASLVSTAAFAGYTPIQVVTHQGICNELQVKYNEEENLVWRPMSGGGRFSINTPEFQELKKNVYSGNTFNRGCSDAIFERCEPSSKLTFNLKGPSIAQQTLPEGQSFSIENHSLVDFKNDSIIGKANLLLESDRRTDLKDPSADFGRRQRIVFAVLYFNPKHPSSQSQVNCTYVTGNVDPKKIAAGECLWLDKNSKASNGLPYCW